MRVIGNNRPASVTVEKYLSTDLAEVRLRENVVQVTVAEPETGVKTNMYQYDEYALKVPYKEGLQGEIESNLQEWLSTGKSVETVPNASVLADLQSQNAEYEAALSEIESALGVNT